MKTLPQRLLARIEMGNADERYLLIITLNFPASGFQLHHGATQPTRLVLRMMPGLGSCYLMPGYLLSAYSGLFSFLIIHWFRTPGMNWGVLFVCLFVLGGGGVFVGFLFYSFHLWDLVFPQWQASFTSKEIFPPLWIYILWIYWLNTAGPRKSS